jgi:serine/threonine protein phosphatase PrpC
MILIKHKLSGVEDNYLLAVADGHGHNGHFVSKHIKKCLV